ncbi:galactose mutarotase [Natronospirillum operosum]|uniref:Aldose 1-epimerase n=1 Tax=Natronospirillum operosum TaxID=2759953 RepID=A0A4Z0W7M9_9GAMM|nr:aldose epimerase family protein [Natronospirillum operosum]TGG90748.1 galactose mutarotase [Natronospirillum operosum]
MATPAQAAISQQPMIGHHPGCNPTVYTLQRDGIEVQITDAGASLYRLRVPDAQGQPDDILCAPRLAEHFVANPAYMGATVGRYANRIAGARFTLDGTEHSLVANEGDNQLHGGEGWHRQLWQADILDTDSGPSLKFTYRSVAGEGGFPGTVVARVRYSLLADRTLQIAYYAETDAPTVVNMTNHAYFNLHGAHYQGLRGHHMRIPARQITETGPGNLPTGRLLDVAGTPFDLRQAQDVGMVVEGQPEALQATQGYDHNYVFTTENTEQLLDMAIAHSTLTGRTLRISSTQPGMQFYTGNFMGGQPGPEPDRPYDNHQAFCCEPQHFPDTPNQPGFPTCVITPDRPYRQTLVYRFGVED